jgi:hypothetical protein
VRSQRAHKEFAHTEQDLWDHLSLRLRPTVEKDRAPRAIVLGSVSRDEVSRRGEPGFEP